MLASNHNPTAAPMPSFLRRRESTTMGRSCPDGCVDPQPSREGRCEVAPRGRRSYSAANVANRTEADRRTNYGPGRLRASGVHRVHSPNRSHQLNEDGIPMTDTKTATRDWSATLFLPKTDFPMQAGLPAARAAAARALGQARPLPAPARGGQGPAEVHPARRPALRQRQHPHRHRAQQDPEGHGDALPADAGLRFQLRAGLGLPRPADRVEDRGAVPRQGPGQGRGAGQRVPRASAASSPSTGSTCSARSSSASASRATGSTTTRPWTTRPRPPSPPS